jgi:hypothetical protein
MPSASIAQTAAARTKPIMGSSFAGKIRVVIGNARNGDGLMALELA